MPSSSFGIAICGSTTASSAGGIDHDFIRIGTVRTGAAARSLENATEAMDLHAVICCRRQMSGRSDLLVRLAVLVVIVADLAACASDTAHGCPPCPTGTTCVERFDGTCHTSGAQCVATTENCPANTCSAACEQALCPTPYQCKNRPPCGTEAVGAFLCYGA